MSGMARRVLAAASFSFHRMALPASAQETVRIRGTIERIDGPVFVVKNRDGAELKLTVTDNPLFVAIVPSKMADIKQGMFVGSAGMMQEDGTQKAIEVHIFPESMRGTGEGHYDWDLHAEEQDDQCQCRAGGRPASTVRCCRSNTRMARRSCW